MMIKTFQWTMVWEQTHSSEEEQAVRTELQDAFESGALLVCPRCQGMDARISADPINHHFHAIIDCTCQLSDPLKFAVQTMDGTIPG